MCVRVCVYVSVYVYVCVRVCVCVRGWEWNHRTSAEFEQREVEGGASVLSRVVAVAAVLDGAAEEVVGQDSKRGLAGGGVGRGVEHRRVHAVAVDQAEGAEVTLQGMAHQDGVGAHESLQAAVDVGNAGGTAAKLLARNAAVASDKIRDGLVGHDQLVQQHLLARSQGWDGDRNRMCSSEAGGKRTSPFSDTTHTRVSAGPACVMHISQSRARRAWRGWDEPAWDDHWAVSAKNDSDPSGWGG